MSRKMSLLYIPPENGLEVEGLLLSGEVEETDKFEFSHIVILSASEESICQSAYCRSFNSFRITKQSRFIDEKQWNQSDRISINSVLNQTYSFPILSLVNRPSSSSTERYFLAVLTLLIFSEMRFFGRM